MAENSRPQEAHPTRWKGNVVLRGLKKNETNMDQKNSWMIQDNIFDNRQLKSLNQVDTTVQRRFFSFEFTVDSGQQKQSSLDKMVPEVPLFWICNRHIIYAYIICISTTQLDVPPAAVQIRPNRPGSNLPPGEQTRQRPPLLGL